jgi:hypothetical protein
MSFYARMQGVIQYPTKKSFYSVYKTLRLGYWCDPEGYFLDEGGNQLSEHPTIDFKNLKIQIPNAYHRNLAHHEFFRDGSSGVLIGTSTDGCFMGWIETEERELHYDLTAWAEEILKETDIPDYNKDFDDYCEWQSYIEEEFFNFYATKFYPT